MKIQAGFDFRTSLELDFQTGLIFVHPEIFFNNLLALKVYENRIITHTSDRSTYNVDSIF